MVNNEDTYSHEALESLVSFLFPASDPENYLSRANRLSLGSRLRRRVRDANKPNWMQTSRIAWSQGDFWFDLCRYQGSQGQSQQRACTSKTSGHWVFGEGYDRHAHTRAEHYHHYAYLQVFGKSVCYQKGFDHSQPTSPLRLDGSLAALSRQALTNRGEDDVLAWCDDNNLKLPSPFPFPAHTRNIYTQRCHRQAAEAPPNRHELQQQRLKWQVANRYCSQHPISKCTSLPKTKRTMETLSISRQSTKIMVK